MFVGRLGQRLRARGGGGGARAGVAVPAARDAAAVAGLFRPHPAEADQRVRRRQQGAHARRGCCYAACSPRVARPPGNMAPLVTS